MFYRNCYQYGYYVIIIIRRCSYINSAMLGVQKEKLYNLLNSVTMQIPAFEPYT